MRPLTPLMLTRNVLILASAMMMGAAQVAPAPDDVPDFLDELGEAAADEITEQERLLQHGRRARRGIGALIAELRDMYEIDSPHQLLATKAHPAPDPSAGTARSPAQTRQVCRSSEESAQWADIYQA